MRATRCEGGARGLGAGAPSEPGATGRSTRGTWAHGQKPGTPQEGAPWGGRAGGRCWRLARPRQGVFWRQSWDQLWSCGGERGGGSGGEGLWLETGGEEAETACRCLPGPWSVRDIGHLWTGVAAMGRYLTQPRGQGGLPGGGDGIRTRES